MKTKEDIMEKIIDLYEQEVKTQGGAGESYKIEILKWVLELSKGDEGK